MATTRAIAFIALQCFQCSTMQVKQQKKSSNKWTCVICNEKQSVLKVFARSHMAKEVRGFVQSFNMSRQFADSQVPAMAPPQSETDGSGGTADGRKAKRIDWTEYLIAGEDEDGAGGCKTGLEDERETTMIVTELPDGLFKRAKLNNSGNKSGFPKGSSSSSSSNLYKRQFSSRSNAITVVPSVQRSKEVRSDTLLQNPTGRHYRSENEDDAGPMKVQMTGAGAGSESRWSNYMTEEDGEFLSRVCRDTSQSKFRNETGRCSCDPLETATYDQAVEDDIHPDFI